MPEFFSSDGSLPLQFLVIFGVILLAMMAVYALFRRFFGRGISVPVRGGSRSRQPRLGIVDIYELDQRRQLILLRRDNVEHLLLVGGPNDVVIERNVQRVAGSRLPADTMIRPEPASDMPFLPGQDDRDEVSSLAPPFAMPVAMPSPLPEAEEVQAPRLDPPLFEPKLDVPDKTPRPEPAPVFAPAPARRERANPPRREAPTVDEPWREAAAERAASAVTVPEPTVGAKPTASAAEARPTGRSAIASMARQFETVLRKQAAPSARPTPEPAGKVEPTPPVAPPAMPPVVPPIDPTPAPASDPLPEPAPEPTLPRVAEAPALVSAPEVPASPPKSEPATDPVAAGMSSAPNPLPEPKPEPKPEPTAPPSRSALPMRPTAETRPAPELIRPTPELSRLAPEPLRPAAQPAALARPAVQPAPRIQERTIERPADRPSQRPEPNVVAVKPIRPAPPPPEDKPAPEPRRGANPFSVEEIEAEFARLLGRPLSRRD